jgi:hypothetical protein
VGWRSRDEDITQTPVSTPNALNPPNTLSPNARTINPSAKSPDRHPINPGIFTATSTLNINQSTALEQTSPIHQHTRPILITSPSTKRPPRLHGQLVIPINPNVDPSLKRPHHARSRRQCVLTANPSKCSSLHYKTSDPLIHRPPPTQPLLLVCVQARPHRRSNTPSSIHHKRPRYNPSMDHQPSERPRHKYTTYMPSRITVIRALRYCTGVRG